METKNQTSTEQLIATSGEYTLVLNGKLIAVKRNGELVCTEDDGDTFLEHVGILFGGAIELALAMRGPIPEREPQEEPFISETRYEVKIPECTTFDGDDIPF